MSLLFVFERHSLLCLLLRVQSWLSGPSRAEIYQTRPMQEALTAPHPSIIQLCHKGCKHPGPGTTVLLTDVFPERGNALTSVDGHQIDTYVKENIMT